MILFMTLYVVRNLLVAELKLIYLTIDLLNTTKSRIDNTVKTFKFADRKFCVSNP